jgi:hypothetical protein
MKSDEIEHLPNTSASDPLGLSEREREREQMVVGTTALVGRPPRSSNGVTTEEGR